MTSLLLLKQDFQNNLTKSKCSEKSEHFLLSGIKYLRGDFLNTRNNYFNLASILRQRPQAFAVIKGNEQNAGINGLVKLYNSNLGVVVVSEVKGLPSNSLPCEGNIFAFHVHEGNSCTGNLDDPFFNTGMHYNPIGCPHPYHAGDMPPLFSANGYAVSVFLTNRFTINEIIGKTVVIHSGSDDFTTQPSGNAGERIACGVIVKY